MSEYHKQYLPIVASHVDRIGYTFQKIEASLGWTGERADLWAMARRPIAQALPEHPIAVDRGLPPLADLVRGSTSVHELKASVQDLRADEGKPWRKPGVRALGERRFYWIEHEGPVRPEHIPEKNGWGIVVFTRQDFRIVRPAILLPCLYRDEHELAVQVLEHQHRDSMVGEMFAPRSFVSTSAPRQEGKTQAARPQAPSTLIQTVGAYLAEGPATTAQLSRQIETELGKKITAAKLVRELEKAKRFTQDGIGGSWTLKTKEATQ